MLLKARVYQLHISQCNTMECYWKLTLVLVSMAAPTLSFPSGAPQTACQTLAPDTTSHGAIPQVTDIPYVLNLSAFYDQATGEMAYTPDTVYNGKTQANSRP